MNRRDFDEFRDFLFVRMPHVEEWFDGRGKRADETADAWFEVLGRCDPEDARKAVAAIHAGDEPEPRYVAKLPAAIAAICRKIRAAADEAAGRKRYPEPRLVNDPDTGKREWVYACLTCKDTGRVSVWHPDTMRSVVDAWQRGAAIVGPFCVASVLCTCRAAFRYRRAKDRTYDPAVDLALWRPDEDGGEHRMHHLSDADEQAALVEFVQTIGQRVAAAGKETASTEGEKLF